MNISKHFLSALSIMTEREAIEKMIAFILKTESGNDVALLASVLKGLKK